MPAGAMSKKRIRKQRAKKVRKENFFDYNLLAAVIILICFGLVMLYSASAYESTSNFEGNDMYYFLRQAMFSAGSLVLALFVSRFDYHHYEKLALLLYVVAFLLMGAVRFTPLGKTVNGARRWLSLGIFSFQPSEIAKIAVIIMTAVVLSKMGAEVQRIRGMLTVLAVGGIQCLGAFVLTDNLSTALIILGICAIMMLLVRPDNRKVWIFIAGVALIIAGLLIYMHGHMEDSSDFRLRRIMVWMAPDKYLADGGYQVMQGLYAIGSGGFFGKGLGNSTQKLSTIPEAQNDMIFSIICEELGLFGAILVLLLFGYLLYRLFVIAQNAPDLFGRLIVCGVFIHIALQVILNICVVLNVIPTTGVTLPFVSYGGTSVIFLMIEIGMALNVSRQIT